MCMYAFELKLGSMLLAWYEWDEKHNNEMIRTRIVHFSTIYIHVRFLFLYIPIRIYDLCHLVGEQAQNTYKTIPTYQKNIYI